MAAVGGLLPPDPPDALVEQQDTIWWYDYQFIIWMYKDGDLDLQCCGTNGITSAKFKPFVIYVFDSLKPHIYIIYRSLHVDQYKQAECRKYRIRVATQNCIYTLSLAP